MMSTPRPEEPLRHRGRTWAIIWPFLAIVVILTVMAYASMDVLAAARAFVTGESVWSKAQKEAVYHLLRYSQTHSDLDFENFRHAVEVTRSDRRARAEMEKDRPDFEIVRAGLLGGQVDAADVRPVYTVYRSFRHVSFIERIAAIWEEGDRHIDALDRAGEVLHREIQQQGLKPVAPSMALERIYGIDAELTPLEHHFSETMGDMAREVELLLILATLVIAAALVPIGILLSRRMVDKGIAFEQALRTSEERFELAANGSNNGIWDWSAGHEDIYISPRLQDLLGFTEHDLSVNLAWIRDHLHPDDLETTRMAIQTQSLTGQPFEAEFRLAVRSGEYRWFSIGGQAILDSAGRPKRVVGSMSDTTEYRVASDQLLAEKERLRVTLESIGDAVITTDTEGRVQYLNPAAEALTGWTEDEAREHPLGQVCMVVDESSGLPMLRDIDAALRNNRLGTTERNTVLEPRRGIPIDVSGVIAAIHDEQMQVRGLVVALHDVSQERRHHEELSQRASHDALTGLINRGEFDARLARALETAREEGRDHAVLYLDLDQFKVVNDTCGHAAGDILIKQVSQILSDRLRIGMGDTLARLGGDEFGVLLENRSADEALELANDLCATMNVSRFAWLGRPFTLGVSIGLVNVQETALTVSDVLSKADETCYLAKDKGRNRVQVYHPDDHELRVRRSEMEWIPRIRAALEVDGLCLYAQEILPLGTDGGSGQHVEVLVRMIDADGMIILPMAFIPSAERFGLMIDVDMWVVREAFATIAARRAAFGPDCIALCAINLSGKSVGEAHFSEFVTEQFVRHDVPFDCICFELTESAAINNLEGARRFMAQMQAVGCKFALDDFGVGFSSLSQLRRLPVDYLKIDGGFVRDMLRDPTACSMVKSINEIGHVMGKKTIAEFAEDGAIVAELRRMGVDFAQGDGVGQPIPFDRPGATPGERRRIPLALPG